MKYLIAIGLVTLGKVLAEMPTTSILTRTVTALPFANNLQSSVLDEREGTLQGHRNEHTDSLPEHKKVHRVSRAESNPVEPVNKELNAFSIPKLASDLSGYGDSSDNHEGLKDHGSGRHGNKERPQKVDRIAWEVSPIPVKGSHSGPARRAVAWEVLSVPTRSQQDLPLKSTKGKSSIYDVEPLPITG